jgi:drug/metabolite transporter (DMT)-like permease
MIRHLRQTESTSNIFASQCIFTLIIGASTAGHAFFITDPVVLGSILLASITVVGGQLSITEAFRHINVAKGSISQMLPPALTVVCSASLLGELFSAVKIPGGCAILFASFQIVTAKNKPAT